MKTDLRTGLDRPEVGGRNPRPNRLTVMSVTGYPWSRWTGVTLIWHSCLTRHEGLLLSGPDPQVSVGGPPPPSQSPVHDSPLDRGTRHYSLASSTNVRDDDDGRIALGHLLPPHFHRSPSVCPSPPHRTGSGGQTTMTSVIREQTLEPRFSTTGTQVGRTVDRWRVCRQG